LIFYEYKQIFSVHYFLISF